MDAFCPDLDFDLSSTRHSSRSDFSRWIEKAQKIADRDPSEGGSPHPHVRVGAIIVNSQDMILAESSNRFASGLSVEHPERLEPGYKSLWMNCAEQLALAKAAREGRSVYGTTLFVTLDPCAICAGMIVDAGVAQVVLPEDARAYYPLLKPKWFASLDIGMIKLIESGVIVQRIKRTRQR